MLARRASTWHLILLVAFAAGSFALEEAAPFAPDLHTALQLAIFLSTILLMWLWVRHDAVAPYAEEAARLMLLDLVEPAPQPFSLQSELCDLKSPIYATMSLERPADDPPETDHVTRPDSSELA